MEQHADAHVNREEKTASAFANSDAPPARGSPTHLQDGGLHFEPPALRVDAGAVHVAAQGCQRQRGAQGVGGTLTKVGLQGLNCPESTDTA